MRFLIENNIEFEIADRKILDIDQVTIHLGDRIGLVGKNGQGKTLLINYLMGNLDNSQTVDWNGTFAYFNQLTEDDGDRLSGGEKTLRNLERVFSEKADVLFLDEPSNNLDWNKVNELEKKLTQYKGAYVVVSHDRSLLDHVCDKIWELDNGKITEYHGDFSFYEQQKELELKNHYAEHENYLKEKNRLEASIQQKQGQAKGMRKPPSRMGNSEWQLGKNKAAGKQKKVERVSKVLQKRLDNLEKVDKPFEWENVKMDMSLSYPIHRRYVLSAKDITKSLNGKLLYKIKQLNLFNGSKTAILGENGSGKTTLINQLLNHHENVDLSIQARIGYFQQALEKLPQDKTIYDYVKKGSAMPQHIIRIILGRLHFTGEDSYKKIGVLSGGERVKVAIAKLLVGDYNVLVLDEPTNHLDLEALKAVEALIADYPGTVLFVSHDRRFVEKTADHLWIIKENQVTMFEGNLHEYESSITSLNTADSKQNTSQEDVMVLETKLTETISKLSISQSPQEKEQLEQQYQVILKQITSLKEGK